MKIELRHYPKVGPRPRRGRLREAEGRFVGPDSPMRERSQRPVGPDPPMTKGAGAAVVGPDSQQGKNPSRWVRADSERRRLQFALAAPPGV